MSRQEDVELFLSSGHIWPPTVEAKPSHPFIKALKEVLLRLPDEVFDVIEYTLQFIVQDDDSLAMNVPFEKVYPGDCTNPKFRLDTIVVYERSFKLSHEALVGLLAHEIAHSVVERPDHFENEKATDEMVVSWGFEKELGELRKEKNRFAPAAVRHFDSTQCRQSSRCNTGQSSEK